MLTRTRSWLAKFLAKWLGAIERPLDEVLCERLSVKDFGAKGDGVTDDTEAIKAAISASLDYFDKHNIRMPIYFPSGGYRTSATLRFPRNAGPIQCDNGTVFQNIGNEMTFPCMIIEGGARKHTLGTFDRYQAAFIVLGNTHNIEFQTISRCTDGFIIRADKNTEYKSSLDNVIRGVQIGLCTNAIVFEQNADSQIQQGNEVRVNFVSETNNTVVFRNFDGFTHTKSSNWDSNFIELIASDPLKSTDASIVRNYTPYGVANLKYIIASWCGGWDPSKTDMVLIRGPFLTSTFEWSMANRVNLDGVVDAAGLTSFGSCILRNTRYSNLGAGTAALYQAVPPGQEFNNGIALREMKFGIKVTVPPLKEGQTHSASFWHQNVQVNGTARAKIIQVGDPTRGKINVTVTDAGTEKKGMVRLWFTNVTSETFAGGDFAVYLEVE